MASLAEKGLIKKLLTTSILAGTFFFNSFNANAQENYQPKYNTSLHTLIREVHKENDFITPKILDRAVDLSKGIITKQNYTEQEAKNLMKKIDSLIFKQNPNLNGDHINYNKSLIYLAIAEENNLPLYPVLIPEGMLIRWDQDGKHDPLNPNRDINKGDFNWDPSTLEIIKDEAYISHIFHYNVMDFEGLKKGVYLENLDKKKFLAVAYWQKALILNKMQRYGEARECADKSIEINPNHPKAYQIRGNCLTNLGYLLQKKEFYEYAIEDYNKAQELYFDPENYYGIGFNLYRLGKYNESEEYYNKALNIFEDNSKYLASRYLLYTKTNQKEKAEKNLEKLKFLKEKSQKIKKN